MFEIIDYLATLWRVIGKALWLEPDLLSAAGAAVGTATAPRAFALAIGVVLLAGVSSLLGQSTTLFINRVRRARFALSLVLNGVLLVGGWLVWSLVLWLVGLVLFPITPTFQTMLLLVALSYAPLVFGFLILIPWLGTFIQRLLYAWSYIIAAGAVMHEFQVSFILAVITTGIGWLVLLGLTLTIGRPITALHNILRYRIAGSQLDATTQDILMQYARRPPDPPDRGATP
ncbi:MAG: hypothetical protein IT340_05585 [Chloroflexi bacterium]|nr:hypothetical protein [Chloroflexota bacterium]